ncbi:autotransporter domain-containing protein [Brucella haematophila]|uniref:autotransporter domain-containing protein n=1 Tax=Brucella haematophila TaxID=419474 RepID=UPI00110E966F|nr:autotransporter domain-containing protein [Brucella haematophila]TMU89357.1 autotransporter domain-containing protein [Brucella haematophila]
MNTVLKRAAALLLGTSALMGCVNIAMADDWTLGQSGLLDGFGENGSGAVAVSADGKVIVGSAFVEHTNPQGLSVVSQRAATWVDGVATLDSAYASADGSASGAVAVSANGKVIIGWSGERLEDPDKQATVWLNGSSKGVGLDGVDLGDGFIDTAAEAHALSGDGSVIVGSAQDENRINHAVKWVNISDDPSVEHYATDLNTLGGNSSDALAVSRDGNVIVGWAQDSTGKQYATSWVGDTTTPTQLGASADAVSSQAIGVSADGTMIIGNEDLGSNHERGLSWATGQSNVTVLNTLGGNISKAVAVSGDGKVVVGFSDNGSAEFHAVSWLNGSAEATDLNTLGGNSSTAKAVSNNGAVIVGGADYTDGNQHAAAWVNGSTQAMDLGTLGRDTSVANAVSDDGTVIVGSVANDNDFDHVALWKLVPPPAPNPTPDPTPAPTPVGIDVTNTVVTVAALAHDTFSVMESQRATLGRLQTSCDVSKAGESCYSISTDIGKSGNSKDMLGWMTLGHAFTDNFSAGVSVAHSLWRDLPGDFDHEDNNLGGGLYARWRDQTANGSWYVQGSAAINRYDVKRTRRVLGYTEPGTGDSTINGWGVQLEAGQSFDLANKSSFGYYGGLRYDDLKMDGYTETNAYFPFTYSDVKSQRTTAYLGANYGMALTDKVRWSVNAEIEQDLSHKDPSVTASADYVGSYKFDSDAAHTRGSLSTTVSYAFSDAVSIGVTPYVNRTVNKDTGFGAIIGLSGKF